MSVKLAPTTDYPLIGTILCSSQARTGRQDSAPAPRRAACAAGTGRCCMGRPGWRTDSSIGRHRVANARPAALSAWGQALAVEEDDCRLAVGSDHGRDLARRD